MVERISNLDLLDFSLELAEEQEKIQPGDKIEIDATISSAICIRIELAYTHAIHRITEIGYRLDWANHINRNKADRPTSQFGQSDRILQYNFSDIESMPGDQLVRLNKELYENMVVSSFRELCELFAVYLDHFYELAFTMEIKDKSVSAEKIKEAVKFRELKLQEKFGLLEQEYGLSAKYKNDIFSMYRARNLYSHSDPYFSPVSRKKRQIEITWLGHTLRFRKQNSKKWIEEKDMPRPFNGTDYEEVQTKFFDKNRRQRRYLDRNGKPDINEWDVREICHFFIYIYEEYQRELIRLARRAKFHPRNFKEYRFKLEMALVGEDLPTK